MHSCISLAVHISPKKCLTYLNILNKSVCTSKSPIQPENMTPTCTTVPAIIQTKNKTQRSEARQNYEHTFKWITLNIQQHTPWLVDVQKPKTLPKTGHETPASFSASKQGSHVSIQQTFFFKACYIQQWKLQCPRHFVVCACASAVCPNEAIGGVFYNGRSFLRLITQKVQYLEELLHMRTIT